ncbi:MAG: ankyrin repeat domain-containing protein [Candidatus Aureabacteria bacterium]|nr:ankyrin repeat domain-containing protein [Candidatus Auribacterota bacterium]
MKTENAITKYRVFGITLLFLIGTSLHRAGGDAVPQGPASLRVKGANDPRLTVELLRAADLGSPEEVMQLIESGADVNGIGAAGETPLFLAAQKGRTETVRLLLGNGTRVDTFSRFNPLTGQLPITPLMAAASQGHADVVRLLLYYGADMSIQVGESASHPCGVTALYLAEVKGHKDVATILNQASVAGEGLWKYMVIIIWILLGTLIMRKGNAGPA